MNTRPPIATLTPTASEAPRRPADFLQPLARRVDQRPMTNQPQVQDQRKLTVSRGITVAGELTGCAKLVVEGRVEADLSETRAIEISPDGFFKGNAEIDQAEIAGRFEGTITVRQRLFIRSTGKVVGTIRYGTVEIEAGGEIAGDVQVSGG